MSGIQFHYRLGRYAKFNGLMALIKCMSNLGIKSVGYVKGSVLVSYLDRTYMRNHEEEKKK